MGLVCHARFAWGIKAMDSSIPDTERPGQGKRLRQLLQQPCIFCGAGAAFAAEALYLLRGAPRSTSVECDAWAWLFAIEAFAAHSI